MAERGGEENGVSIIQYVMMAGRLTGNRAARVIVNQAGKESTGKKWNWEQFRECFRDPQVYFVFLNTFLACVPNG